MKGFSRVILIGYLGGTPELQTSKNGSNFTRLSVSTHRTRQQEDGKWNTSTEWHRVIVWGKRAEICVKHLTKGAPLAVEGILESYKSEREGGTVNLTSIVAEHIHFLPNPKQQSLKFGEDEGLVALKTEDNDMSVFKTA